MGVALNTFWNLPVLINKQTSNPFSRASEKLKIYQIQEAADSSHENQSFFHLIIPKNAYFNLAKRSLSQVGNLVNSDMVLGPKKCFFIMNIRKECF
jgi:hypothetical protein